MPRTSENWVYLGHSILSPKELLSSSFVLALCLWLTLKDTWEKFHLESHTWKSFSLKNFVLSLRNLCNRILLFFLSCHTLINYFPLKLCTNYSILIGIFCRFDFVSFTICIFYIFLQMRWTIHEIV